MTEVDRFFSFVKYSDNCWEWDTVNSRGYGTFYSKIRGGSVRAHRWSYQYFIGPLNNDYCCHHCDNPSCVNPFHLFKGNQSANMKDCFSKGRMVMPNQYRALTHCKNGHEYTHENTHIRPMGSRECRACKRDYNAKYRQKKHEVIQLQSTSCFNQKCE